MTSSTEDDIIKLDHGSGLYIVLEDGRLLLQRRNRWEPIKNPGKISVFAGKAEKVDMRKRKGICTPHPRTLGVVDPVQAHLGREINRKFYFINAAKQANFLHEVRTVAIRECGEEIEGIWQEHAPSEMLPLTEIDPIIVKDEETGFDRLLSISVLSRPVRALPDRLRIKEGAGRVAIHPDDLGRLALAGKVSYGTLQAHLRAKEWARDQRQLHQAFSELEPPVVALILDPPTVERRGLVNGHSLRETLANLPTPPHLRRQHYAAPITK